MILDDDLQAILKAHQWLDDHQAGVNWLLWEGKLYADLLMLCQTVQRQRNALRDVADLDGRKCPVDGRFCSGATMAADLVCEARESAKEN